MDINNETFMIHVAIRKLEKMPVHSKNQAHVEALFFDKASTKVPTQYSDYSNIFSVENVMRLRENIRLNKHAIKLEEGQQPLFRSIYSLGPIELETLKTYIKTNLANGFIWPSKSFVKTPIFFDKKPNDSLHLCLDNQSFYNITIKNQYPLPLIGKSLDWLDRARRFI